MRCRTTGHEGCWRSEPAGQATLPKIQFDQLEAQREQLRDQQALSKQQTEAGVILEVAKLLKTVVNDESAQLAADQLIDLVKRSQGKT